MRNRKTREALCLWAITACLLAVSCVQLPEPVTPEDLSRIAAEKRFRQLEQRKLLRVAVSTTGGDFAYLTQDGIFEGQEVKAVLNAAHRNGWRVFFFASRPESLAAYVRSGRADLAIGGLTPEAIRTARLTPVMEYSLEKKRHAFASWNDAAELKERLGSGTIPTKSDSQLEKTTLQE